MIRLFWTRQQKIVSSQEIGGGIRQPTKPGRTQLVPFIVTWFYSFGKKSLHKSFIYVCKNRRLPWKLESGRELILIQNHHKCSGPTTVTVSLMSLWASPPCTWAVTLSPSSFSCFPLLSSLSRAQKQQCCWIWCSFALCSWSQALYLLYQRECASFYVRLLRSLR